MFCTNLSTFEFKMFKKITSYKLSLIIYSESCITFSNSYIEENDVNINRKNQKTFKNLPIKKFKYFENSRHENSIIINISEYISNL